MTTTASSVTKKPDLNAISSHMAEVEAFSEKRLGLPKDEAFIGQIQTTRLGLFRLVVMGEIKKGKSSFINALCGIENLVPELSEVATSTIFKIRFGQDRKYTAFLRKQGTNDPLEKKEIAEEDICKYGTETGNPENRKNVEFIGVEAPSPALSNGFIIVDTPGVGGLFKHHRDITWRYAPNSDAIFFITDSTESPIGEQEVLFLKDLLKVTNLIYFVQTKTDKVEEKAVISRKDNNVAILINKVGIPQDKIVYFTVSSKLKKEADKSEDLEDLKDSGFIPLMQFLNQTLKTAKDNNLSAISLKRTETKIDDIKCHLQQRLSIFEADSAEKQNAIKVEIQEIKGAIEKWVVRDKPELDRQVRREMEDIVDDINKGLRKQKENYVAEIKTYLEGVDAPEVMYKSVPGFVSDVKAGISAFVHTARTDVEDRVRSLIEGATVKMGVQISSTLKAPTESISVLEAVNSDTLQGLGLKTSATKNDDLMRAGYMGANMYGAIGGTIGAVVGSVIPVIGTALGSGIGVVIGSLWGGHDAVVKVNAANARKEVMTALNSFLNEIYDAVQSDFKQLSRKMSDQVSDAMGEIIRHSEKRLAERKAQIEARSNANAIELKQEEAALKSFASEVEMLSKTNKRLHAALPS